MRWQRGKQPQPRYGRDTEVQVFRPLLSSLPRQLCDAARQIITGLGGAWCFAVCCPRGVWLPSTRRVPPNGTARVAVSQTGSQTCSTQQQIRGRAGGREHVMDAQAVRSDTSRTLHGRSNVIWLALPDRVMPQIRTPPSKRHKQPEINTNQHGPVTVAWADHHQHRLSPPAAYPPGRVPIRNMHALHTSSLTSRPVNCPISTPTGLKAEATRLGQPLKIQGTHSEN